MMLTGYQTLMIESQQMGMVFILEKIQHLGAQETSYHIQIKYRIWIPQLARATAKIMWLESLLSELKVKLFKQSVIWCDNLSVVSLSTNAILHSRTKSMEIDLYVSQITIKPGKFKHKSCVCFLSKSGYTYKALSVKKLCRLRNELKVPNLQHKPWFWKLVQLNLYQRSFIKNSTAKLKPEKFTV